MPEIPPKSMLAEIIDRLTNRRIARLLFDYADRIIAEAQPLE